MGLPPPQVSWPLSLILSRNAIIKYQLLFRHLFHCKHVERQLSSCWLSQQSVKKLGSFPPLSPSHALRQRMLHFLHNIEHYMMLEVHGEDTTGAGGARGVAQLTLRDGARCVVMGYRWWGQHFLHNDGASPLSSPRGASSPIPDHAPLPLRSGARAQLACVEPQDARGYLGG